MQGLWNLGLKFSQFFFALNVPANKAENFVKNFAANFAKNFAPNCPPSNTETSPKTSLCRNPLLTCDSKTLERCKGHTHKGYREKALNVMNFRIFQGVFRVFSGHFHGVSGFFSVFSGCFQGVFPYALSGYALWTLSKTGWVAVRCLVWRSLTPSAPPQSPRGPSSQRGHYRLHIRASTAPPSWRHTKELP